jgi:curved DNA-binding protein CbpA
VKTFYELLAVKPDAPADEIKRAFRREIARYHPDKVQHLGIEFQEMAATRAAALTEAYRVLTDAAAREKYDVSLVVPVTAPAEAAAPAATRPGPEQPREDATPAPRPAPDIHGGTMELVRRAVISRLGEAAAEIGGTALASGYFDASFEVKPPRRAFRRGGHAGFRVAAKIARNVDAELVEKAWTASARLSGGDTLCLLLLGHTLAPARDLAAAIAALRRRSRAAPPVVIPIHVHDWDALVPLETPAGVRTLLDRLKCRR